MTLRYDTGAIVATYDDWRKRWSANSQYGYTMEWFNSEVDAIEYCKVYYAARPKLDAHFIEEPNPEEHNESI